jgi:hypothetical protein
MLIAVWGRDGTGKSTLCDVLGSLFSKQGITAVINTDLTQPTLPARVNGVNFDAATSLGKALYGIGTGEASRYLHQHPKQKSLFYAGLTDRDEFMSYEIGLEADEAAQYFVGQCGGLADTVILDLSGQRTDPFVPCALTHADKVIVLFTPDVQGVCWFNAVKPLLHSMNAQDRVLSMAAMASRQCDLSAVEKAAGTRFSVSLPLVREFHRMRDTGESPLSGTTFAAHRYARQAKMLYGMLQGGGDR